VCRVAAGTFESDPSSAVAARRWATGLLVSWSLERLSETVILLLSEAVTNAVVHATSRPIVRLAVASGVLEVGVDDNEPRLPNVARAAGYGKDTTDINVLLADSGRGLVLIEALADEWGATALTAGKRVWFHLDIGDWLYRADCRCARHEPGRDEITLGSGLRAHHIRGPWQPNAVD
jgi:anti-sigma regulatory factor (Ser/Thr protein kinase)